MTIKINDDRACINVWTAHPLILGAVEKLPPRVLYLLHPDLKIGVNTVCLGEMPVGNISHFIDYRFAKMRMELTEHQLLRKFTTAASAFVLGMTTWTTLYFINQHVWLTSLIGFITVLAMCSLFSRRYIYTVSENKVLHDLYVYFIKEHQYSHETISQSLSNENQQLRDTLARLDEQLIVQHHAHKEEEHKHIIEQQKIAHENRELADGFSRVTAAYQDLLNHTDTDKVETHIQRCRSYGIDIYYDDDLIPPTDTIH